MLFLPFLLIGLIVLVTVLATRNRKIQAEARRREEQAMAEALAQKQRTAREAETASASHSVSPSVPTVSVTAKPIAAPVRQPSQATVIPAYAPDRKTSEPSQTISNAETASAASPLHWTPDSAMEGILYAEILGKPKALRKH